MVLSNIINKYTCNFRALPNIINRIKSNKQVPILDFANEDYNNFKHNYKVIHDSFVNYPDNTFALKFSSLGLSKDNENNAFNLSKKIINIAEKSKSVVLIDAEQNEIQKTIDLWTGRLVVEFNKKRPIVYKTYQMYRKDSMDNFKKDLEFFKNSYFGIKLVRGAYYNTDINNGVLFENKNETDKAYNDAVEYFNTLNNPKHFLIVASHNEHSIKMLDKYKNNNISVAHLLGFSDNLSKQLVDKDYKVYKYLPYGDYKDTLPYLIRRLYENYPMLLHLKR